MTKSIHALAGAFALALAGSSAAQNTYQYTFGKGLVEPNDVAVYRPCNGGPSYVFVADLGLNRLVRYNGTGSNDPAFAVNVDALDTGPWGVAADDSIASPNQGQIYTTTHSISKDFGLLWIYDTPALALTPTCVSIKWFDGNGDPQWLREPKGVAVDAAGNVYVAEPQGGVVLKVDAADVAYAGAVCIEVTASLSFDTQWFEPIDVSVDKAGRMHVAHRCGCVPVFNPDGTLISTSAIWTGDSHGVDAKNDHADTYVSGVDKVLGFDWDYLNETRVGKENFGAFTDPRGIEFQKYEYTYGAGYTRCEDRYFLADAATSEIIVYGKDFYSTPLPNDAVAFYRFDPGTLDSALSNHMTLTGPATPYPTAGRVRCGLAFPEGIGGGLVPDHASLDFGAGDFTFETWICASDAPGVRTIFDKRDGFAGYHAFLYDGYFGFQLMAGAGFENMYTLNDDNFVGDGKWHHVAVTVERKVSGQERVRLYVDCQLTYQDLTPILGSVDNDVALSVGVHGTGLNSLTGALDEPTFYSRSLNACELMKICKAGCAGKHGTDVIHHFCTAEMSASGCLPSMDYSGTPSLSGSDPFILVAKSIDADTVGFLTWGTTGEAFTPFQGGVLCVAGPLRRSPLLQATGQGDCGGTLSVDFNTLALSDPSLAPGTSVWAQFWVRDLYAAGGPPGLQRVPIVLTDALHFTMEP
ncbi:MAG: hypothetical protein O2816_02585 [Planctomycetota bacterium]|nr:hypothetical protein [Planctomycetota bacterium]